MLGLCLAAYGNPTIDFSVVSVTLVSPLTCGPPSNESLPLTPSLEFTVSSPSSPKSSSWPRRRPLRCHCPGRRATVSTPTSPLSSPSFPSSPEMVSTPPWPLMVLATAEPVSVSLKGEPINFSVLINLLDPSPVAVPSTNEATTPTA